MAHPIPKIEYGSTPTVITFDYPEKMQSGELLNINKKDTDSLSGVRQTQLNYIEGQLKLRFSFVSEAIRAQLETFLINHAALGKSFKYFVDKNSLSYVTYEMDITKYEPKKITAVGVNSYIYEIDLVFRRAVGEPVQGEFVEINILNNQAVALSIPGLLADSSTYRSLKVFYEIFRKTDSSERICNGWFTLLYKESTPGWDIAPGGFDGDPAHGVTFSVTSGGQVQYTSDNQSGTNYEGVGQFKTMVVGE